MQIALIYAFVVVVTAPLIGVCGGHVWAKANDKILRDSDASTQKQTA